MAQATDYNLANQSGADFRAELNEILAASVSLNSGSSEPTTMYAHQLWVDTSSNVLKIRNAANNAWLTTGVSITASNTFDINAGTINGITSLSFSSGATVASILDEDNLSSDSATALATQQSIKAYVDSQVTAQDLDITDGSSTIAIDLDSETLSLLGGTGITSTASGNGVTFAIGQAVGTSDNVVFNQVTGALVGNASTATTLATARTISGVSFDGSANITLDTDDIGEGSNKYFTAERVDDQVNTLLTAGANISLTYDDAGGTLTIANTNSADITSVVAGDGLTGGGTSGAVTLAVGVDESSIEINSDALRVKASGITNAMLGGSIANNKLANSSVTINSNSLSLGGTLTLDTDDIGEGSSNLYYTDARANSAIDARVTNTFINNLSGVVADTATALATARTIALSGDVVGSVSFDGTSDVTISSTIQANSVALGTDTTGNYVATITGTANKVSVSGSGSETAGVTLSLPDDVQIADSLTVAGNLTVNGDLTYLDTTNLKIEDNLFELNANLTGSPVNDSGMLINRGNQNNGIFMWDESADKFTMGLTTADGTSTGNITLASLGTLVANLEGNVTGNVSGTAATVTGSAQTAITSLGTLTGLTVDAGSSGMIDFGDVTSAYGRLYADSTGTYIGSKSNHNLILRSNHTAALTLDTSQNATFAGTINSGAITTTGDINLGDNDKAIFGAGSDLQIYHDGSNSYIAENGTGDLYVKATQLVLSDSAGANYLVAYSGGSVNLYNNNSAKLATTSTGIDVTGVITTDGLTTSADINFGDNDKALFGAGSDLQIYHDGSDSYIKEDGNGNLIIAADDFRVTNVAVSETMISADTDGVVKLYYDNSTKLATTSTGIQVTGNIANTSGDLTLDVAGNIELDADGGQVIFKDGGTNIGRLENSSSNFVIKSMADDKDIIFKGEDGGNNVVALTLDMSDAGSAYFNNKVGIGTSSPQDTLHVVTDSSTTNDTVDVMRIEATSSGTPAVGFGATIDFRGERAGASSDSMGRVGFVADTMTSSRIDGAFVVETAVDGAYSERLRIDSSGNVGLGTASPARNLSIVDTSAPHIQLALSNDQAASNGFEIAYDGSANYIAGRENVPTLFTTNNTTALTLDASQNATFAGTAQATRLGLGVAPHATAGLNITSTNQNIRLNNGSELAIIDLDANGALKFWSHGDVSNNEILFYQGSGSGSESMRLDGSGRLGLGTTSPAYALDVRDGIVFSGRGVTDAGAISYTNTAAVFSSRGVAHTDARSNVLRLMRDGTSGVVYAGYVDFDLSRWEDSSVNSRTALTFKLGHGLLDAPDEKDVMTLRSNGNVGIGTDNPNAYSGYTALTLNNATNGGAIEFENNGTRVGTIFSDQTSTILKTVANVPLLFGANDAEKMRIDSSGNLLVGTTSQQGKFTVEASGAVQGLINTNATASSGDRYHAVFYESAVQKGSITSNGTATAYNTSSDARLKDVTGEARGLKVINALNPVAYNWKADGKADEGLIAQEVLDIVPNAVSGSEEEMYQMDYSKLVVHLVKAVQELKAEIEELKGE